MTERTANLVTNLAAFLARTGLGQSRGPELSRIKGLTFLFLLQTGPGLGLQFGQS